MLKYDFIIFGASGYTGKVVVEHIIKTEKKLGNRTVFTWAIAGRSVEKLTRVLADVSEKTGHDYRNVDIVTADLTSSSSLLGLAKKCRILLNCVGPYQIFGETVIRACIEAKTHYIDVSGEPIFMEKIQHSYHDEARDKGVYILSACGISSIPSECGINFLQQKFNGDMNSVEIFVDYQRGLPKFNIGSWHSMVYCISRADELRALREDHPPEGGSYPSLMPKLQKTWFHYNSILKGWCYPFPGPDAAVAYRTQRYLYEHEKKRPVQVQSYSIIRRWKKFFQALYMAMALFILSRFRIGRFLLHQFPKAFSGGLMQPQKKLDKERPNPGSLVLVAEGWSSPSKRSVSQPGPVAKSPDLRIVASVKLPESAYVTTAICMIQSGITLLREEHNFPIGGGVYTPGVAFRDTSLIDRLKEFDVSIEVTDSTVLVP